MDPAPIDMPDHRQRPDGHRQWYRLDLDSNR